MAALPMVAELVVEVAVVQAPAASITAPGLEIVVGDGVIRAPAGVDEGLLVRTIRAARASMS